MGRRRLRNTVLDFLSADKDVEAAQRAKKQYDSADCMTDRMAGLMTLASIGEGKAVLEEDKGRNSDRESLRK